MTETELECPCEYAQDFSNNYSADEYNELKRRIEAYNVEIGRLWAAIDKLNEELWITKADGRKLMKKLKNLSKRTGVIIVSPLLNEELWKAPRGYP